MKKIEVKGTIVSDSQAKIYQYFGIPYTSPSSVILPETGEDVLVEINSGGGEVFAGSEIFTKLKAYEGKVTARVVGLAASAASVILMGADEIEISPTAQIMIHNAWSSAVGDSKDMLHEAEILDGINQSIMNAYTMKTDLSRAELHDLMETETWMGADRAVELGFADRIMFEEKTTPMNVYASAGYVLPEEVLAKVDKFMQQDDPFKITPDWSTFPEDGLANNLANRLVDSLGDSLADKVASRLQTIEKHESNKPSSLFLF